MLIESETRKTKAPEVRHVIGSNPFQQKPNAHGIGNRIPPTELKIKICRTSGAYYQPGSFY